MVFWLRFKGLRLISVACVGNAKYIPLLERQLGKAGTGWLVGRAMTYADVLCLEVLEELVLAAPGCLTGYPLACAFHAAAAADARMAAFLASDWQVQGPLHVDSPLLCAVCLSQIRWPRSVQDGIEEYKATPAE
jgi:hypothetical protein